jgi:hypothetical protein
MFLCVVLMCQPNTADMLLTLQLFVVIFHVMCCVMLLIANMSTIQQPASTGEVRQERRQCNESCGGSSNATKNNVTMALGGGGGDGQW